MFTLDKESDVILADFLKDAKVVTLEDYEAAVEEGAKNNKGIMTALLEKNKITEDTIADSVASQEKIEKITINNEMFKDRPLKDVLSDHFILRNRIIPYKLEGNKLTVIIADMLGFDRLSIIPTEYQITAKVATLSAFTDYTKTLKVPEFEKNKNWDGIERRGENRAKTAGANKDQVLSPKEAFQKALSMDGGAPAGHKAQAKMPDGAPNIVEFVNNVLEQAIVLGVSDIHFEKFEESARVRFRCDGVLKEIGEYADFLCQHYSAITTRIKIMSSLDISERRLPQDGAINFDMKDGKRVDIRVSVLPTVFGERVVMRIMNKDSLSMPLEKLGFPEDAFKRLTKAIRAPQGMILVTGPTGSGKSTTLYAVLNALNNDDVNLMTAEDPVEFNVEGIGQVYVKENIGLTFSAALKSFLRQDPEVIMVGEIRDKDTGDIAVKAALTGHLVLSTLHTNDAPSTVTRLINMGIPPYLLTSSLSLVVAQRLGRVLCQECKEEDKEQTKETLVALGFSESEAKALKAYKPKGCSKCMDTGIKGRRAIHEVLSVTIPIKEAILKGASDIEIKNIAQKEGFKTMQETGKNLIKEGIISVGEYQRILVTDD